MTPLKHIYPIRNEEIIGELSEDQVRIGKLEIEVENLKKRIATLNDLIIDQTQVNRNIVDILSSLNSKQTDK